MVARQHRRVRMRLPARLRWTTPFGQKIELVETRDVSRGGLLVSGGEFHAAGVPLWVTFPYDRSLPEGQPEVLARVVRSDEDGQKTSLPASVLLAIHFPGPAHPQTHGNGARAPRERRGGPRHALAVPIRVRPERVPWFEETMSLDLSPHGMRFRSHREYAEGEVLAITREDPCASGRRGSAEFRAKVVRVFPAGDGVRLDVAVCRAT